MTHLGLAEQTLLGGLGQVDPAHPAVIAVGLAPDPALGLQAIEEPAEEAAEPAEEDLDAIFEELLGDG